MLHHSGYCGWIPYLWEKLLETFGLKRTYLAKFFLLKHPFRWPSCWRPKRGSHRKHFTRSSEGSHPSGEGWHPHPSLSLWCPQLLAGEASGCLVQNQTYSPAFTCLSSALFSPSLSTYPFFLSCVHSTNSWAFNWFYWLSLKNNFVYVLFIFGCAGSSLLCGVSPSCGEQRLLFSCSAQVSHCGGFSCWGARALAGRTSSLAAHELSSCRA